jgi:hypothetical protein
VELVHRLVFSRWKGEVERLGRLAGDTEKDHSAR